MSRTRIVLETSNQRKLAIVEAAALQGSTLVDWFEEQVTFAIPRLSSQRFGQLNEIDHIDELGNPETLFKALSTQNWSFTEDDTRYLTHDLHPYPAKFIPQIPAHLIARLSMPGDVILDPFGGSATTAVEAVRLGRRAISFDANPLSALIGRVKTGFMTSNVRTDLEQLCATVEGHTISSDVQKRNWSASLIARYHKYMPEIPNAEKWFSDQVSGELCLLLHLIDQTTEGLARDAALLALSRIIIRVSNQESETRYVSVAKDTGPTLTLRAHLEALKTVSRRLETAAIDLQFADARFLTGDSRNELSGQIGENSVDLIVTSPPYPNATDYHLYHRFRLFWLGFDPRFLGRIEIGSHLRHQRNNTSFEEYRNDMAYALEECAKVLMPGRYAVFVIGDALFKGKIYSTFEAICSTALDAGLKVLGVIERPIHQTKRSFAKPARRARAEQLVVLWKPNQPVMVRLNPPAYKMWSYEAELRAREIEVLTDTPIDVSRATKPVDLHLQQPALWQTRRLAFTGDCVISNQQKIIQTTWQKILENGDADPKKRKDPKYVTHGLHPFKGKFYPQLAKSLLNISGAPLGGRIFDPYCGSGTTLVEGMLNGFATYGCDVNPLAAKISHAKTAILTAPRDIVDLSIKALLDRLSHRRGALPDTLEQFSQSTHKELLSWFPEPVLYKLNWLLAQVRLLGNQTLMDFFEVIISSIIREVSDQDPTDLRIRRRKEALQDAPVLEMYRDRLEHHHHRLQKYWSVAGRQPGRLIAPIVTQGDSRQIETLRMLDLKSNSIDCVVTSPPYATALPYIDTDRLSLLAIMGMPSRVRSDLEKDLTGSREIRRREKCEVEALLLDNSANDVLPPEVVTAIRQIYRANSTTEVGFRRANMPSLLWRYFTAIKDNLKQVANVLKPSARAFYVVGNSRTKAGETWVQIETCKNIALIVEMIGLHPIDIIDIDVTTENYKHIKNSISKNQIIIFEKS